MDALKDAANASSNPSNCKGCKGDKNKLLAEVRMLRWMEAHEYDSITQMCGSVSQKSVPYPAASHFA